MFQPFLWCSPLVFYNPELAVGSVCSLLTRKPWFRKKEAYVPVRNTSLFFGGSKTSLGRHFIPDDYYYDHPLTLVHPSLSPSNFHRLYNTSRCFLLPSSFKICRNNLPLMHRTDWPRYASHRHIRFLHCRPLLSFHHFPAQSDKSYFPDPFLSPAHPEILRD